MFLVETKNLFAGARERHGRPLIIIIYGSRFINIILIFIVIIIIASICMHLHKFGGRGKRFWQVWIKKLGGYGENSYLCGGFMAHP